MTVDDRVSAALQVCIEALETGVEFERCLDLYPDLGTELRGALEGAVEARYLAPGEAPEGLQRRSRARLLGHVEHMRRRRGGTRWFGLPKFALATLGAVALFFMGAGGLFAASAKSLPGDTLYPLKRSVEALSLSIAPSSSLKRSLQSNYEKRRLSEAERLVVLGRSERVTFEGILRDIEGDELVVDEFRVLVPPDLQVPSQLSVGEAVQVSGEVQADGWILAENLILKSFQLQGRVDSISGDKWQIDGRALRVTPLTLIQPGIREGDRVIGLVRIEGELVAQAILRFDPAGQGEETQAPEGRAPDEPGDLGAAGEAREFTGTLESIAGQVWVVDGQRLTVTEGTEIDGDIRVGDLLRVQALVRADGVWLATDLDLRQKAGDMEAEAGGEGQSETTGSSDDSQFSGVEHEGHDDTEEGGSVEEPDEDSGHEGSN